MCPGRPEHVLDGDPLTNVWRNAVHPSGKMHAGVWDCRRGRLNFPAMRARSCASLPKAPPRLKTRRAAKTLVKPGDAFIIPQGSRTVWRIEKYVKKYYLCVLDLED